MGTALLVSKGPKLDWRIHDVLCREVSFNLIQGEGIDQRKRREEAFWNTKGMEGKELGNSEPKLVWVRVMSVQRERVMGSGDMGRGSIVEALTNQAKDSEA